MLYDVFVSETLRVERRTPSVGNGRDLVCLCVLPFILRFGISSSSSSSLCASLEPESPASVSRMLEASLESSTSNNGFSPCAERRLAAWEGRMASSMG
jgi:hypothetical protein